MKYEAPALLKSSTVDKNRLKDTEDESSTVAVFIPFPIC